MDDSPETEILTFQVENQRNGAHLRDVIEVLRAVTVTPLPGAPPTIEGVINVRGNIIPVVNVRARFRLPRKPADVADQLLIVRAGPRVIALRVDRTLAFVRVKTESIREAKLVIANTPYVAGVVQLAEGLTLLHDLQQFLSQAENEQLNDALSQGVAA